MIKWMDTLWSKATRVEKTKNVAYFFAILSFGTLFILGVFTQNLVSVLRYILDKLLLIFSGIAIFFFSVFYQMRHDESVEIKEDDEKAGLQLYEPDIPILIGCSHNLDKVRSNLRTGIIFIFGIGSALLIWAMNYGSVFGDAQLLFIMATGGVAVFTILAILFSFSNPIVRLGLVNIGEGLASLELTEDEYRLHLIDIINEKETHLSKMRSLTSLGLLFFIFSNMGIFFSNFAVSSAPPIEDALIAGVLSFLNVGSAFAMLIGLLFAGMIFLGRAVVGMDY